MQNMQVLITARPSTVWQLEDTCFLLYLSHHLWTVDFLSSKPTHPSPTGRQAQYLLMCLAILCIDLLHLGCSLLLPVESRLAKIQLLMCCLWEVGAQVGVIVVVEVVLELLSSTVVTNLLLEHTASLWVAEELHLH